METGRQSFFQNVFSSAFPEHAVTCEVSPWLPGELYVTVLMDDPPPAAAELARAVQLEFDALGRHVCVEVRPRVAAELGV